MRFRHEQKYDAPPADVHAMLTDPGFRERVCAAQDATTATVTVEPSGHETTVVVDQTRPADGIPGFARAIVGDRIRVLQEERWSGPGQAVLGVTIPGKPGELRGTITVTGDDASSVEAIDGDLKVDIPLLGGKLEALVSQLLVEALELEHGVGVSWLSEKR